MDNTSSIEASLSHLRASATIAAMDHYICTGGCGGVSDVAKACETEGCPKKGQPFEECGCADGSHEKKAETETRE